MSWAIEVSDEASLTPAEVFAYYLEPSTWGTWGHNTKWARARGPVVEGAIVDVKAGYGKVYPVLIRKLEPERYIECEVHPPGMLVVNRYAVEASPHGVRLRHGIEVSGRFAALTKAMQLDRLYARLLRKEISRLIALAQARSSDITVSGGHR